jgi:hypothetical protein
MSLTLPWRRVAFALVLLMAAAGILALRSSPDVDAAQTQSAGPHTFVYSNLLRTPGSGGHLVMPELGEADGVVGVACTGASPRVGNAIPGQVVTQLGPADTRLRVLRNDGTAITSQVRLNCVIEFSSIPD